MYWEPVPQLEVLKVRALDVGSKPLLLKEKLGVVASLLIICSYVGGGVYGKSVSTFPVCFDVDIFLFT